MPKHPRICVRERVAELPLIFWLAVIAMTANTIGICVHAFVPGEMGIEGLTYAPDSIWSKIVSGIIVFCHGLVFLSAGAIGSLSMERRKSTL